MKDTMTTTQGCPLSAWPNEMHNLGHQILDDTIQKVSAMAMTAPADMIETINKSTVIMAVIRVAAPNPTKERPNAVAIKTMMATGVMPIDFDYLQTAYDRLCRLTYGDLLREFPWLGEEGVSPHTPNDPARAFLCDFCSTLIQKYIIDSEVDVQVTHRAEDGGQLPIDLDEIPIRYGDGRHNPTATEVHRLAALIYMVCGQESIDQAREILADGKTPLLCASLTFSRNTVEHNADYRVTTEITTSAMDSILDSWAPSQLKH